MTRKRFVKLAMAEGASRNDAVDFAMTVICMDELYRKGKLTRKSPNNLTEFLKSTGISFGKSVEVGPITGAEAQFLEV